MYPDIWCWECPNKDECNEKIEGDEDGESEF